MDGRVAERSPGQVFALSGPLLPQVFKLKVLGSR